ncbi:MAG TPA: DUF1223 domain-containing protein [Chthoniobacterales bacterium]
MHWLDFSWRSRLTCFFAFAVITSSLIAAPPSVFESTEKRVVLLELFTSEGCSSCPPAEAWFRSLKDKPGLWTEFVPIAFHVDYWNYLGWKDPFSSADYTRRQQEYATQWNASTIYTPAFVLNGKEWSRDGAIAPSPREKPGKLRVTVAPGGQTDILFIPKEKQTGPLLVELAPLAQGIQTDVRRGENAGRKLVHDFVVLTLVSATLEVSGDGTYRAHLVLPEKSAAPVAAIAAWVRSPASPAPIQAIGGWIKNR